MKELLTDGRKSTTEIAKEIAEKKETVDKQYQKLKKTGIIQGATTHINYKKFGYIAVAYMLITTNPQHADALAEYIRKIAGIYAVYSHGPKGNLRVVTTLKTPQHLDELKDQIKQQFPISNLKTVIWTDVKEMHSNLTLDPQEKKDLYKTENTIIKPQKTAVVKEQKVKIDEIDLKIAEKLSENGRIPFRKMAQEIGISLNTAKRRYVKLKNNGVLKVTTQMDFTKMGYQAIVLFFVTVTAQENSFSIIEQIGKIPDVISIMKTIGDYDLIIYTMVRDTNHLLTIQDEIGKIQGITRMDIEISRLYYRWPTPGQYLSTF